MQPRAGKEVVSECLRGSLHQVSDWRLAWQAPVIEHVDENTLAIQSDYTATGTNRI